MYQSIIVKIYIDETNDILSEVKINAIKQSFNIGDILYLNEKVYKIKNIKYKHEFFRDELLTNINVYVKELIN